MCPDRTLAAAKAFGFP
jgi:hypothetical protein